MLVSVYHLGQHGVPNEIQKCKGTHTLQSAIRTGEIMNALQALEEAKTRDRLYIPSRYQLFTLNQVRQVSLLYVQPH